ncbi:MAG: hypothetical protein IJ109_05995 [Firmicutes bacterium]|nr:hypothetical protein [Bacillota bacterium]
MLKKITILVFACTFLILCMGCAGTNKYADQWVGQWYFAQDPEREPYMFNEDYTITDESDGSLVGRFDATEDTIKIYIDGQEDPNICNPQTFDDSGYTAIYFDDDITLVDGYEGAIIYYEQYIYVDPSDIWAYDFSGNYYEEAQNESLEGMSEYDKMVKIKTEGGYTVDGHHGGFTLKDNYSGYWYGVGEMAVTVDIDRDNRKMRLIDPSGGVKEYDIEWSDDIQEYYFIYRNYVGEDDYFFRLENVN